MANQVSGLLSPWLRQRRVHQVLPHLQGRILDFGCGVGELARFVGPDSYVGVDIDAESLAAARQRFPRHYFTMKMEKWEEFDHIVMLAVLEHIVEPLELLKRLKMLLKPAGEVLLTTPHPVAKGIHNWGAKLHLFNRAAQEEHEQLLDRRGIEKIALAAGLEILHYQRFLLGFNQFVILSQIHHPH